ncbi:MAG TPA: hypothetical protein VGE27_02315 [Gemmatimonas sp.]|uniref:hypothetical protein n=1 Tax=Gemmatimonas sp. TaxID=1962908 RepID=UPI002ED7C056
MPTFVSYPRRCSRVVALASLSGIALSLSAHTVAAQGVSLSAGLGNSNGGRFAERGSAVGAIAYDHGKAMSHGVALAWRLGGTATLHNGSDLVCEAPVGGACSPLEPDLLAFSAAGGIRIGGHRASLSLLAGPNLYATRREGEDGASGVGLLLAGTGMLALTPKVALVGSVEQHHVRFVGQNLRVNTILLGVRLGPTVFPR